MRITVIRAQIINYSLLTMAFWNASMEIHRTLPFNLYQITLRYSKLPHRILRSNLESGMRLTPRKYFCLSVLILCNLGIKPDHLVRERKPYGIGIAASLFTQHRSRFSWMFAWWFRRFSIRMNASSLPITNPWLLSPLNGLYDRI